MSTADLQNTSPPIRNVPDLMTSGARGAAPYGTVPVPQNPGAAVLATTGTVPNRAPAAPAAPCFFQFQVTCAAANAQSLPATGGYRPGDVVEFTALAPLANALTVKDGGSTSTIGVIAGSGTSHPVSQRYLAVATVTPGTVTWVAYN